MVEDKENMKELREEIDELKNLIKNLEKNQANAYKDMDKSNTGSGSVSQEEEEEKLKRVARRKIEKDIRRNNRRTEEPIHDEPLRPVMPPKPPRPPMHSKPVKPAMPHPIVRPVIFKGFEGRIDFDSDDFKKSLKEFTKRVEIAAKEGEKAAKHITDKLSKKVHKVLERENERLRDAVDISTEEYEEIVEGIEEAREEMEEAQQDMERARQLVIEAQREIGAARRRIERALQEGDQSSKREAEEDLAHATEDLQNARDDIRDARNEISQAKREFARLQRRASSIHEAQSKNGGSRVIREGDIDLGSTFTEYADRVISSVAKNLESTIRIAVDGGKRAIRGTVRIDKDKGTVISEPENSRDIEDFEEMMEKAAELLSALGDKNRLLLLKILEHSPQYQKELAEETGWKGGTFKHHTDILQEVNFITREAIRGRYLITQLGIEALKLAELIHYRKEQLENYESEDDDDSIDIDIED
ncbi:MAG: hypothetical protein KGD64_01185 [Candidatus Heimdallarchaeota archaeon]|nr:hypothetical protein [Candidatus Heimdallarchaeota archaeon]